LTGRCSQQSNIRRNISTLKYMLPRPRSTSKASCHQTLSTTTRARLSRDSLRRSSILSLTGRVETRCSVLPHRASGNSTSGRESSADRSDFKPS
jgi:hypothetical protein